MASFERTAVVANTDDRWFEHFRPSDVLVEIDEVNFWRPAAQTEFRALTPGEPLFFRLKHPVSAVAGFGFFAVEHKLSIQMAWDLFGPKNGDPDRGRFERRVADYRARLGGLHDAPLSCLVLRDAIFLPRSQWISWGNASAWAPNIVSYKAYDLDHMVAGPLVDLLRTRHPSTVPDLIDTFLPVEVDARETASAQIVMRDGQGTFRVRLLKAYRGQCAITGEHAVPVLEAAHIQPYLGAASNHIQNGLLLRSDLHRLYDAGYLTVLPDLHVEVSRRLKEEFDNGKEYYAMAGRRVAVPAMSKERPSTEALSWHAENVFK